MLLWFGEYVVTACTKKWINKHDNKKYQENYIQLCKYNTEENMATIDLLHVMFVKGWNFTSTSTETKRASQSTETKVPWQNGSCVECLA
jgi:hypothetical protein